VDGVIAGLDPADLSLLGVYFQLSVAEWLFVFGVIGLVLTSQGLRP